MEENYLGLQQVILQQSGEDYEALLRFENYENVLRFSPGGDRGGQMTFVKDLEDHVQEYVCQSSYEPCT